MFFVTATIENHTIIARATVLDPRCKTKLFSSTSASTAAVDRLSNNLRRMGSTPEFPAMPVQTTSSSNSVNWWGSFYQAERNHDGNPLELRQYLEANILPNTTNPIEYWKNCGRNEKNLAKLATKFMCAMASSVPVERMFSEAGNIMIPERSRLTPEHLSNLLFLHQMTQREIGLPE